MKRSDLRRRNRIRTVKLAGLLSIIAILFLGLVYVVAYDGPCSGYTFGPDAVGSAYHQHFILRVFDNGVEVQLPAFGGGDTGVCTQPIHNHHSDGPNLIHLESSSASPSFTLGAVMSEMPTHYPFVSLMWVDGHESVYDPSYVVHPHDIIILSNSGDYSVMSASTWPYPAL